VSSANNFECRFKTNGKSLIKIEENNGPRIEPCGKPSDILQGLDRLYPTKIEKAY